jgi:hypothetical protein
MGSMLMSLARQVLQPQGVALAIATCLEPTYLALYKSLSELAAAGPSLLHQAEDDERDLERYMAAWIRSISKISNQGRPTADLDPSGGQRVVVSSRGWGRGGWGRKPQRYIAYRRYNA